jgi:hypothetical protein
MNRQTAVRAALAAAVLLVNCTRDKSVSPSYHFPEKRLIRVDQTTFYYNSQGGISGIRSASTDSYTRSHDFFYENAVLVREDVQFALSGGRTNFGRYLYEYDAKGVLNRVQGLPGDGQGGYIPTWDWIVETDSLARPVALKTTNPDGSTSVFYEILYDSRGNIREFRQDFESGAPRTVFTYEYDGRKNPYGMLKGVMECFHAYNANNVLRFVHTETMDGQTRTSDARMEYDYDPQGYPVHEKRYADGEPAGESEYEYEWVPSPE